MDADAMNKDVQMVVGFMEQTFKDMYPDGYKILPGLELSSPKSFDNYLYLDTDSYGEFKKEEDGPKEEIVDGSESEKESGSEESEEKKESARFLQ